MTAATFRELLKGLTFTRGAAFVIRD